MQTVKVRLSQQISVGEVVIVKDKQLPRGQWKLGVVDEVMKGRDGVVRVAHHNYAFANYLC